MCRICVAFIVMAVVSFSSNGATDFGSIGPGGANCSAFVALVDRGVPVANFVHWAQGYIAGVNNTHP